MTRLAPGLAISVVVPTHNEEELLVGTVGAILPGLSARA